MQLVDDLPKAGFVLLVAFLGLLALWAALDRRSPGAARLRQTWRGGGWRIACALVGAALFLIVAEDVFLDESTEVVPRLDQRIHAMVAARTPRLHDSAALVSRLTGDGLAVLVLVVTAGLALARRGREALVVLAGTAGAWVISGLLKIIWRVPRPRAEPPFKLVASFGFPSGHTLVTLVAWGLIAWSLGRRGGARTRAALIVAAALVATFAGAARVAMNAHWTSDVIAGLALGTVWLSVVVALAERALPPD